jgi:hypothetical protein
MNSKFKLKRIFQWFSRRSGFFITALLCATVAILFWFLSSNLSSDNDRYIIGLAAFSAFLSTISAISSLFQAVETQRQRENLERPYITAYFDSSNNGAFYFVIENNGNMPALDVSFKFDPIPVDYKNRPFNQLSLFSCPITFLPNGKVIRQIVGSCFTFLADGNPLKYEITIKYYSAFGGTYEETIHHDLDYLKQVTLPRKTSDDYLKDISDELKDLIRCIAKAQGSDAFLVESPAEYSNRMKKIAKKVRGS